MCKLPYWNIGELLMYLSTDTMIFRYQRRFRLPIFMNNIYQPALESLLVLEGHINFLHIPFKKIRAFPNFWTWSLMTAKIVLLKTTASRNRKVEKFNCYVHMSGKFLSQNLACIKTEINKNVNCI